MLSHSVLATNITNLTDARYFAAREVPFLSFIIDEGHPEYVSPVKIAAIKEWVEGPKILGYTEGLTNQSLLQKLEEYDLDGIHLGPFATIELVAKLDETTILKEIKEVSNLQDWLSISDAIIYTGPEKVQTILFQMRGIKLFSDDTSLLSEANKDTLGLVLKGSEEEKPGYKSYDHIDDILESLEIYI